MEWNDEVIAQLRALWADGLSTAEIGRRLAVTKNAIVGKAHRLELPPRPSPIRRDPAVEAQSRPSVRRVEGPTLPPLPSVVTDRAFCDPAMAQNFATPTSPSSSVTEAEAAPLAIPPAVAIPATVAAPAGEEDPSVPDADAGVANAGVPDAGVPDAGMRGNAAKPIDLPAVPTSERQAPRPAAIVPRPVAPAPPRPVAAAARPYGRIVTCCWPLGEPGMPGFRFCDVPSEPGRPYCEDHVKVAYVKIRDRREDAA